MFSKQNFFRIRISFLLWETFMIGFGDASVSNVFLNSYAHCGHDVTFEVTPDHYYEVKSDVSPNTGTNSFRDCETTFHSERADGQLCLMQEGRHSSIKERNAQLILKDGVGNDEDPTIYTLNYFPDSWRRREYCTETPYLHMLLRKINKVAPANIRDVFINLKVLDIESKDRALYMVGLYCESSYKLSKSQVSVYNRPPPEFESGEPRLNILCPMKFEKERNETKRICLAYIPTDHINCTKNNWTFDVSVAQEATLDRSFISYHLTCQDRKAKKIHTWCANNQTHFVWLIFQRHNRTGAEHPKMFRFIITDYTGTEESLKEKVIREFIDQHSDSDGIGAVVILVIIIVVVIICAIIGILIFRYKNKLSKFYREVRQKE